MYGYIYLTTNLINGRKYIGQKTSSKFLGESYLGSGKILRQAVAKYGSENFKVELIEACESKEELDKRERYHIKVNNAVDSDKYYNIAFDGQSQAHRLSPEERKRASENAKLRVREKNSFYNKHHSEETKRRLAESSRRNWKKCLPSQKGKIYVTNGYINKMIFPGEEVPEGFHRGLTHSKSWHESQKLRRVIRVVDEEESKVRKERVHLNRSNSSSVRNQGRVWVNNGLVNKFIYEDQLKDYEGFHLGRLQSNESHKGTFFITDGLSNKLICKDDEIPEGWRKGTVRH